MSAAVPGADASECGHCGRALAWREAAGRRFGRCAVCANHGLMAQIGGSPRHTRRVAERRHKETEPLAAVQLWCLGLRDRDAARTWGAAHGLFMHTSSRVGFLRAAPYAGMDTDAPAVTAALVSATWPPHPLGTLLRYVQPGGFEDLRTSPAPPADLVAEWPRVEPGADVDAALIDIGPTPGCVVVGCGLVETLAASSVLGFPPLGIYARGGLRERHARLLETVSFRGVAEAVLALPDATPRQVRDAMADVLVRQGVVVRSEAAGWPTWAACAWWRQQLRWDRQYG